MNQHPQPHPAPASSTAYATLDGRPASGLLLICDHASNTLPQRYGTLGLPAGEFARHIAWDSGAAAVVRHLAGSLGAPAVMTTQSRLLIDCNRGLDDPTLIMPLSDGTIIPGNRALTEAERTERIERYYRPYHNEISQRIDAALTLDETPVLVSIHSFTDVWRGKPRPWHCGVLWDKDPRLATLLLRELRGEDALIVGDNAPYSGRLKGDCLWQHGTRRGLAHAIIEIRQDLIDEDTGQRQWALRLARILSAAMAAPAVRADLQTVRAYGSHTD